MPPRSRGNLTLVYELLWRIERVQAGEMRLRGPNGEVVTTVEYTNKLGHYRRVHRLTQHGRHIGVPAHPYR
jgi:hypothetical protein